MKILTVLFVALATVGPVRPASADLRPARAPAVSSDDSVATLIRQWINVASPKVAVGGAVPLHEAVSLRRFYHARSARPAWTSRERLLPIADALYREVRGAAADGLRPEDYHLRALEQRLTGLADRSSPGGRIPAAQRAELDLLLSDAFLHLARHLLEGRVDPGQVHPGWTLPRRQADLVRLLESVAAGSAPPAALATVRPGHADYAALRGALARYRGWADAGGWHPLPPGPALREGDTDVRVTLLRERLRMEHGSSRRDTSAYFDASLAGAVRAFQRRHALEDDGIVGPRTAAALDAPVEARLRQIELSLERLRWLPADLGPRHVRVFIPGFELHLSEAGRDVLHTRIVGGRPDWPTPIFSATMTEVVLSPYWNVPPNIAAQEILPQVRRDPGYLARNDMRVLSGWGSRPRMVDPYRIDWRRVSAASFPYRFRQEPGPRNPLGGVKFIFPNQYHVYLHDTPARELFARPVRAFSHGCMRVERPLDLAEHLLRELGWPRERIMAAIAARRELAVPLREPVPVHVLYRTAWIGADGGVEFRDDLYGHDGRLARLLDGPGTARVGLSAEPETRGPWLTVGSIAIHRQPPPPG
jgi:L,D-transpeptidase YcbB